MILIISRVVFALIITTAISIKITKEIVWKNKTKIWLVIQQYAPKQEAHEKKFNNLICEVGKGF